MDENDEKQEFRVVDKRRFTSEGDTKAGSPEFGESVAASQPAPKPAAGNTQSPPKPAAERGPAAGKPAPGKPDGDETMDFSSLVISLATQALVMMGEVPNPESRSVNINLDAAKQTIDILALLEEKTKGNLNADEVRLLAEVMTNLRLAYVNKMNKR